MEKRGAGPPSPPPSERGGCRAAAALPVAPASARAVGALALPAIFKPFVCPPPGLEPPDREGRCTRSAELSRALLPRGLLSLDAIPALSEG